MLKFSNKFSYFLVLSVFSVYFIFFIIGGAAAAVAEFSWSCEGNCSNCPSDVRSCTENGGFVNQSAGSGTSVSCSCAGDSAQTGNQPAQSGNGPKKSDPKFVAPVKLNNPITGAPSTGSGIELISQVVKNVINTLLGLVGIFAMIGFIWGGVTWMTSYGDTAKIERGKKMMTWGVVGLVVIFSSYAITNYIFQAIGATGAATTATTSVNLDNDLNQLLEPLK